MQLVWELSHLMRYANEKTMTIKTNTEPVSNIPITEEVKDQNSRYSLSKFDFDLFHEEDDISNQVVRVKSVSMPNHGQKWKITIDNKLIFTIESTKISKKERLFLQTIDGFNFMLAQAKLGIKSLNNFKVELKKMMSPKPVTKKANKLIKNKKAA